MDSANRWSQIAGDMKEEVRTAQQSDAAAITRILREGLYSHIHADWHYPAEWLGTPSFVVLPQTDIATNRKRMASKLFARQPTLAACLAVAADPKPAAWVRLAAIANRTEGRKVMASMLSAIAEPLRDEKVSQIAWLLVEDWPETWLPDLGFEHTNEVITYSKLGTNTPRISQPSDLQILPAESADLAALAEIESRAFDPLWRHSELSLSLAKQQALSFDVAWFEETPVGFQFSSSTRRGAHLSRITVDKNAQKSGIGSALLAHALDGYARRGISSITLNTQLDNIASQKLYEKFGFERNGERFPVWNVDLSS